MNGSSPTPQASAQDGPPPLPPIRSGVAHIVVPGTVVWFTAFVVLLFFTDFLREHDAMIWLWTCLAGGLLGVAGLGIFGWQRSAARKGRRGAQTSALD
ncbi:DUF2530 domain-containing protein [Nakamurella deserti]|uniref:DUF2530 domain-containing protein n=1 Tax=Nakamurella deserti TaxID=2164074 RepID=UPI000DBEA3DE|nr:DUF2530 domain-containing protein [Nakamurella deserti]